MCFASRRRGDGRLLVQEVRQGHHDQIDVVALEHVVSAGKRQTAVFLGEGVGALAIRIEHRHQLRASGLGDGARMPVAGAPRAENRDAQRALGRRPGSYPQKCSNGCRIHWRL